jgi:hypothetical protein
MDIFNEIYLRNDVQVSFSLPTQDAMGAMGGMPKL